MVYSKNILVLSVLFFSFIIQAGNTEGIPETGLMATSIDSLEASNSGLVSLTDSASGIDHAVIPERSVYQIRSSWMPMGEVSFADSVFLYDPGAPGIGTGDEPDTLYRISGNALGVPDDSLRNGHSTALGTGGTLILKFTDNRFYDGPGPDLYFWMPDEAIEDAIVWISEDGQIYRRAGIVSSGHPYLDISGTAETGVFYPLIKIRDDPDQEAADPYTLGATIDAVAGIHTVVVFSIESRLLFEGSQARLMEGADTFLSSAADRIRRFPRCHLLIEAYTGSSISGDLNLIVSQQWAKAVRDFLIEKEHLASTRFSALGLGSSWQFSGNSAAAGASEGFIQIIIFP